MSLSILSDAGWFFFAIWSIAVGALSIAAFGRDLLPSKAQAISRGQELPSAQAPGRN